MSKRNQTPPTAPDTNEADDDFFENSERPYADQHTNNTTNGRRFSLDKYLTYQVLIPTAILAAAVLFLLYYFGVFQVITIIVLAVLLLALSVVVIAYLDDSLTENADLLARIDLTNWHNFRNAIRRNNAAGTNAKPNIMGLNDTDDDDDDNDIFEGGGGAPYYGAKLASGFEEVKLQILRAALENLKADLINHLDNQRRNANIQLVAGIVTSFIGVSILVATGLNSPDTVYYTMLQGSFGLVIVVFVALFFQLYTQTQQRIKHFQNELTNINSRITAFELAYVLEENDAIKKIIADLTNVERNFTMGKNDRLP